MPPDLQTRDDKKRGQTKKKEEASSEQPLAADSLPPESSDPCGPTFFIVTIAAVAMRFLRKKSKVRSEK